MERFRLALVAVENNDFQTMQASAAQAAADRLGISLKVIQIEHDALLQSQKILTLLQSPPDQRPHGILFEPVGTSLTQAARIAAQNRVGWVVLNRTNVDYFPELRAKFKTPVFSVTTSHGDVGKTQGEQMAALVPKGGTVLYIQGPGDNEASKQRTAGMESTRPRTLEIRFMKGAWTEISGYRAIESFLKLSTSREASVVMIAAQNDAMALGARKAFLEKTRGLEQSQWLSLPFIGCDGLPNSGQAAVRSSQLAATVVIPPNAGKAVEALVSALKTGIQPPEHIFTEPTSFPMLASLRPTA